MAVCVFVCAAWPSASARSVCPAAGLHMPLLWWPMMVLAAAPTAVPLSPELTLWYAVRAFVLGSSPSVFKRTWWYSCAENDMVLYVFSDS